MAGCLGGAPPLAPSSTAPTAAVEAIADAETGAIHGNVVDDQLLPIPAAEVAILALGAKALSDEAGVFTFNDLAPGEYALAVAKLGYESAARKVTIIAGEVTNVTITLAPVEIAPEPYIMSVPHVSFIQVGNAWGHYASNLANTTGIHGLMCESCVFNIEFAPQPAALMTETRWECSPCVPPLINADVWLIISQNSTAVVTVNTYLTNGEQYLWTEPQQERIGVAKDNRAEWRINAAGGSVAGTGAEGISYNQRIQLWQTFAYHTGLPEGYSAFPPE